MWIQRGGGGGSGPPSPEKIYTFLSITGQDPLKKHKATKPAFNVGPSLFRSWADDGPLFCGSWTPFEKKLSGSTQCMTTMNDQEKNKSLDTKQKNQEVCSNSIIIISRLYMSMLCWHSGAYERYDMPWIFDTLE